jgi:3,4-dihydroxy-2-butanone 4-phosphate synthase/GTP cyclohydrolase II
MLIAAKENTVRRVVTTHLPTKWGVVQTIGFERDILLGSGRRETAVAIILGNLADETPLVRIHSECFTGEVLGSLRCDCSDQLQMSLAAMAEAGSGLLIYEHQEGRGIGLMAKLQAYALQEAGFDTVEANHALGFAADCRDFGLPVAILHELGIRRVRLLTNNPNKSQALTEGGIKVAAQVPCETNPNHYSLAYLRAKKEKMGHALSLEPVNFRAKKSLPRTDGFGNYIDGPETGIPEERVFAGVDEAIGELRAGRMIVVVDDEDRENEGDLTMAAEMITPDAINFMAKHGRGLICVAMTDERLKELEIGSMVPANSALGGTAFTVSIDLKRQDITTGISAYDRAQTIKMAVNPNSHPEDFARPGHVFPLRARPGGVLERRGQTEAAVDLASLAGLQPAGVICEIINDDGTMARLPDLIEFCKQHDLLMITVADLARYRFDCDYEGALAAFEGMFPVCTTISPTDLDKTYATNTPYINAELIG